MAYEGLAYYDVPSGTVHIDVSEVLAAILEIDTTFIGLIGMGEPVDSPEYYWIEDSLLPFKVTQGAAIDAAVTSMTVATGHGVRVRVNSLLKDTSAGKSEVVRVSAISADTLTIERGYGSTSGEAHAANSVWHIVGNPLLEGSGPQTSAHRLRSRVGNYTQIFERSLDVSGSEAVAKMHAVPDEMAHQIEQRTLEIKREMDSALINGIKSATIGSDTVVRTSMGLIEAVSQAGGNVVTTTEELTGAVINDLASLIARYDNANPDLLLCGVSLARKISTFGENQIRIDQNERARGQYVTSFVTDLGVTLRVVKDANVIPNLVVIVDSGRCKIRPYRPNFIKIYDDGSDAVKRRLIGEYGFEFRNALEAFAIHTNLS